MVARDGAGGRARRARVPRPEDPREDDPRRPARADGLRRYVHIGTGNYNASTARIYEDLGLFTADEEIAADVADLFNYVTGFGRPQRFRKLLVAPFMMRTRLVEHIREVAAAAADGKTARIRLKLNALVDPTIIEELYAASAAGADDRISVRKSLCSSTGWQDCHRFRNKRGRTRKGGSRTLPPGSVIVACEIKRCISP